MSVTEVCEDCYYWQRTEDAPPSKEGWCQRYAPSPRIPEKYDPDVASELCVFPLTDRFNGCGDHQYSRKFLHGVASEIADDNREGQIKHLSRQREEIDRLITKFQEDLSSS